MKIKIFWIVIGVEVGVGLLMSDSASANPYDRRFDNDRARSELRKDRQELRSDRAELVKD